MMRRGWYWWVVVTASSMTTGTIAVVISLHSLSESERKLLEQQAESQRKFCEIVIAQDDAWSETTPTTATGRRVAEAVRKLRQDLGCPTR
jgi:hypothetical protein